MGSFRAFAQRWSAVALRVLTVVQLLTGLGFIGFACYLHFPPEDSLTLGLIVIGALAVAASVFGLIVSCSRACCLTVYLTLGVLVTLAQAGFALYLFIAPQNAVDKLVAKKPGNEDKFHDAVYVGRWVFLGVMVFQVLAMVLAVVLRSITPENYQQFEEEEYQQRKAKGERQLEQLKEKIMGLEAAAKSKSPGKGAVHLAAHATAAPPLPTQRRSLFRSDSEDSGKLEGDLESGTIPALPAGGVRTWTPAPPAPATAWPAAQQPQQQRSFKPSWSSKASGADKL